LLLSGLAILLPVAALLAIVAFIAWALRRRRRHAG
jgi:hypothetical protein